MLVTGGTGFVGRAILRQLHAAGYAIRALVRDTGSHSARQIQSEFEAELVSGDILDPASLEEFFASGDAVIHLVGIISEVGKNTFETVHFHGTCNVIAAARKAGIRRYIQMSALGVRPHAVSRYHQTKWQAEEAVRASGLDYTIFRPSIIYGPGDMFTNLFAGASRLSPIVPVIGAGEGTMQPLPVETVAACFVKALSEPRSIGQTFDLVGPEVMTFNQLLDQILQAMGRRRLKCHIPLPVARGMASVLEWIYPKLLRKAPPLNHDQIVMLQEKTIGDGRAMKEKFGVEAPVFREGIGYLRNHAVNRD